MNLSPAHTWKRRLVVLFLLAAAPLPTRALAEGAPSVQTAAADAVVMTIDGEPVTLAEYTLIMHGGTAEVFNYFHAKSGLADHLGYWKDDGQPENPIRRLRTWTTNEFRRIKTVQRLAKKKGLVPDISYRAFQERFVSENARRRQALEQNQPIYGPKQYDQTRFYHFKQADWEQELRDALAKEPEFAISDSAIENYYAQHKDAAGDRSLDDLRSRIIATLQSQKFQALIGDLAAKAKVEINADVLNGISPRHDP